jgi:mRNA-degrading endonuclease toxin of MazEF toxin-antitoxin module
MKKQFDVWRLNFPGKGEHPVVIISHDDFCAGGVINVLYCTGQRQNRRPKPYEILLNGVDGMDWETLCDCGTFYSIPSAGLFNKRARVSLERRRQIRGKIRDLFRLAATD